MDLCQVASESEGISGIIRILDKQNVELTQISRRQVAYIHGLQSSGNNWSYLTRRTLVQTQIVIPNNTAGLDDNITNVRLPSGYWVSSGRVTRLFLAVYNYFSRNGDRAANRRHRRNRERSVTARCCRK